MLTFLQGQLGLSHGLGLWWLMVRSAPRPHLNVSPVKQGGGSSSLYFYFLHHVKHQCLPMLSKQLQNCTKLCISRSLFITRWACLDPWYIDGITDSEDMNLSKLWEIAQDRGAWGAAVHGVTKSQTWLSDWTTTTMIYTNPVCGCVWQSPVWYIFIHSDVIFQGSSGNPTFCLG